MNIARAWKDEQYRNSLSQEELAQLPASPVELSDTDLEMVQGACGGEGLCGGEFGGYGSYGYDGGCGGYGYNGGGCGEYGGWFHHHGGFGLGIGLGFEGGCDPCCF
ncbi:lanti_MRSA_kill family protein [Ktedonobacteria bacterium brp13]|nr:lanti_MRSA_kill family protein [Ktedonobacteria bacterium brp13]